MADKAVFKGEIEVYCKRCRFINTHELVAVDPTGNSTMVLYVCYDCNNQLLIPLNKHNVGRIVS